MSFFYAVSTLLALEGGYIDHPSDPGGATNHGISLRWYQTAVDPHATEADIEALDEGEAKQLYMTYWWDNPEAATVGYSELPPGLALQVFQTAVHTGPSRAHKLLQRTIRKLGRPITVDGVLGPATANASHSLEPELLISRLATETISYYRELDREEFIEGWTFRAVRTSNLATLCQRLNL